MAILKKGQEIGVCVHHSVYTPAKNKTELKAQAKLFNTWHSSKSWAEDIKTKGEFGYPYIEYHYLMATNGSLLQVQDEKYVLYHAGDAFRGIDSFNLHGVAVCLTGNYQNDKPTSAQMLSLVKLIRDVQNRYKIDARVRGHKETSKSPTACPGTNIGTSKSGWLKQAIVNTNNSKYPPVTPPAPPAPPEAPEVTKLKKDIVSLKKEIGTLKEALDEANVKAMSDEITISELKTDLAKANEYKKYQSLYQQAVTALNAYKKGRFMWIVEFLEKTFPVKKG